MPAQTSFQEEYEQACREAALFDTSHHGKIDLTGADAARFLHNLCTNDVLKLSAGRGCEAFLTTSQAKIVAYVFVYRDADSDDGNPVLQLDVGPDMGAPVAKHLDRYLISEQVVIADRTGEFAQLHLAGPKARAVLEKAVQSEIPSLQELEHTKAKFGTIRYHESLCLPGYDVVIPADQIEPVRLSLVDAGAQPAGIEAYQALRIEAGTPIFNIDIDETNLPQEVGRDDRAISFTKGCYIGQETVARIRTYGHVNRMLVGLKLAGQGTESRGTRLFRDGKEVGQITSSVFSPRLEAAIALAYVRRGSYEPGTVLVVGETGSRTGEVVPLPFIV